MAETKPEKVIFWHHYLPSVPGKPNWWFDRLLLDARKLGVPGESLAPSSLNTYDDAKLGMCCQSS